MVENFGQYFPKPEIKFSNVLLCPQHKYVQFADTAE